MPSNPKKLRKKLTKQLKKRRKHLKGLPPGTSDLLQRGPVDPNAVKTLPIRPGDKPGKRVNL